MLLSMVCWGSWANTQKIDSRWRFELFYLDYTFGLLAAAVLFGLTLGRTDATSANSFFINLHATGSRSLLEAFAGGAIFSIGNILLVAAISVAGMAVAFPVGAGLALVLGSLLNYFVSPTGNPALIFGGIALVCVAIGLDALAYRDLEGEARSTTKGILLSIGGGIGAGLFYPLVAKSLSGPGHLVPYTVNVVFLVGVGGCFCVEAFGDLEPRDAGAYMSAAQSSPRHIAEISRVITGGLNRPGIGVLGCTVVLRPLLCGSLAVEVGP